MKDQTFWSSLTEYVSLHQVCSYTVVLLLVNTAPDAEMHQASSRAWPLVYHRAALKTRPADEHVKMNTILKYWNLKGVRPVLRRADSGIQQKDEGNTHILIRRGDRKGKGRWIAQEKDPEGMNQERLPAAAFNTLVSDERHFGVPAMMVCPATSHSGTSSIHIPNRCFHICVCVCVCVCFVYALVRRCQC